MPQYESADQYPGWRIVGDDDWYTCVYPPEYTPEPAALAFLRAFHPEVIPIFRKQIWIPPNSKEQIIVGHWGFGRYLWWPGHDLIPLRVEMPTDADFIAPNYLDVVWDDKDPREDGPGAYLHFDMRLAHACRKGYTEGWDEFKIEEVFRRRRERKLAAQERLRQEYDERWKRTEESIARKLPEVDWGASRARKIRKLQEAFARGASRPFVGGGK